MRKTTVISPIGKVVQESNTNEWSIRVKFVSNTPGYKALKDKLDNELKRLADKHDEVNILYKNDKISTTMYFRSKKQPIVLTEDNLPFKESLVGRTIQVAFELFEYSSDKIGTGLSPRLRAVLIRSNP